MCTEFELRIIAPGLEIRSSFFFPLHFYTSTFIERVNAHHRKLALVVFLVSYKFRSTVDLQNHLGDTKGILKILQR